MKNSLILLIAIGGFLVHSCTSESDTVPKAERDLLQLKTYILESPEQEMAMDQYLENAYLPALHRAGIASVGVFKPRDGEADAHKKILVLIPFKSLDEFDALDGILASDVSYQEAGKDYIQAAHDAPAYKRIESILLKAFSATPRLTVPDLTSPRPGRVYELRSYQAATEHLYQRKVEMFNEGESELFIKLDFQPVFFAEVLSSHQMPHLIYMTTHADTTAQKANWDAFRDHPDWNEMKVLERYQNTVSHIDKYLLYPTEYSDY